ncbi:unnamed protein product, partial [Cylicostephanus goldi]
MLNLAAVPFPEQPTVADVFTFVSTHPDSIDSQFQFNNSLFGSFDDPLFQARAAQAALADMDVKVNITNPLMRPHDMFSNYLMGSTQDPTNIYHGLPATSEGFDASVLVPTSSDQDQMTPLQQ